MKTMLYPPYKQRRTAFSAYQVVGQQLRYAEYDRQLTAAETGDANMEVHRFRDTARGHTLYVAWRYPIMPPDDDPEVVKPLTLPGSEAVVRDVFGESWTVTDGRDGVVDGRIRVSVSGRPIYIEMK